MQITAKYDILISDNKIKDYLLSTEHPLGRFKARFFIQLGFRPDNWELLRDSIFLIAKNNHILKIIRSEYGIKFVVEGMIISPSSELAMLRTIWINLPNTLEVAFVTAYPV